MSRSLPGRGSVICTWLLALAAVCVTTSVDAETIPKRGIVDQRIRTAVYSPDEVYRLYGFVGFHLDLEFESD